MLSILGVEKSDETVTSGLVGVGVLDNLDDVDGSVLAEVVV